MPTRQAHGQPHSVLLPSAQRLLGRHRACRAAPGQIPKTALHTGGARRPAGCPPGRRGPERSLHHPPTAERMGSLEIRCPHSQQRTPWGRRATGSRLLPAEAATATTPRGAGTEELSRPGAGPRRPAARRRGRRARGPAEGSTKGAQFWRQEKGRARGEQERPDKSRDVLWTSEESRWRRLLVSHGEASGIKNWGARW